MHAQGPVNLALNYGYGLLYGDVWRGVVRAGFDPGIGLLHFSPRSVGGLVYDLVEELRAPLVDRLVLSLIGRGWNPTALSAPEWRLTPRSREVLIGGWRTQRDRVFRCGRHSVPAGQLAWGQVALLRDLVLGKADSYQAFRFRW